MAQDTYGSQGKATYTPRIIIPQFPTIFNNGLTSMFGSALAAEAQKKIYDGRKIIIDGKEYIGSVNVVNGTPDPSQAPIIFNSPTPKFEWGAIPIIGGIFLLLILIIKK
jgi:hypothetical protein